MLWKPRFGTKMPARYRTRSTTWGMRLAFCATATTTLCVTAPGAAAQGSARTDSGAVPVSGFVYDSIVHAPLAGADVQLVDSANRRRVYTARSDSLGHFEIPAVAPGTYIAGFFHPSVDALGIEPPVSLVTVGSVPVTSVVLAIPGSARVMAAICGTRPRNDSSGALVGIVRDADTGSPVAGAKVVLSWYEITIGQHGLQSGQRRVPVQTRDDGGYAVCDLGADAQISGSAEAPGRRTGLVDINIPARQIVRRDFTLGDSTSAVAVAADSAHAPAGNKADTNTVLRGSARLTGIVRGPGGRPVSDAKLFVWGTGLTAVTHSDGRFALDGLPAGTFSVEARSLGYEPVRAAVDLASNKTASVALAFDQRANQLSRVTIMGKRSARNSDIDGFLSRSRNGMGHYITAADIDRSAAFTVTDALRMTPGIRIVPTNGYGYAIYGRGFGLSGPCSPNVFIDGVQIYDGSTSLDEMVQPNQVAGIEVYAGIGGAPGQYVNNGCGVILVWTKR